MAMRILVVSCSPWRKDNSIGNSYTNIFQGMSVELAHICCGSGTPETDFVSRHFHISEKGILNNLRRRSEPCGRMICEEDTDCSSLSALGSSSGLYDFMRKTRLTLFFLVRELIWSFGNWKCRELQDFVEEFQPDLIFAPMLNVAYLNRMLCYIQKLTGKPMALYAWDDVYSLKQFRFSPLFWINRFLQRHYIRKSVKMSSQLFVISKRQKEEYENTFQKPCELLYKGYLFEKEPEISPASSQAPVRFVYTGMLGEGRWKTLMEIGRALKKLEEQGQKAQLDIYSSTPLTKAFQKELSKNNTMHFHGAVPYQEVSRVQDEADVLLFCESFRLKDYCTVRLSFSTKLVDYFHKAKCILAVGRRGGSSIDYLKENDCACVVTDPKKIFDAVKELVEQAELRVQYSQKAWACGCRNHTIDSIQGAFYRSLVQAAGEDLQQKETAGSAV